MQYVTVCRYWSLFRSPICLIYNELWSKNVRSLITLVLEINVIFFLPAFWFEIYKRSRISKLHILPSILRYQTDEHCNRLLIASCVFVYKPINCKESYVSLSVYWNKTKKQKLQPLTIVNRNMRGYIVCESTTNQLPYEQTEEGSPKAEW